MGFLSGQPASPGLDGKVVGGPPAHAVAGGVAASHLFFHLSPERLNFGLPGCVGPQESGL